MWRINLIITSRACFVLNKVLKKHVNPTFFCTRMYVDLLTERSVVGVSAAMGWNEQRGEQREVYDGMHVDTPEGWILQRLGGHRKIHPVRHSKSHVVQRRTS